MSLKTKKENGNKSLFIVLGLVTILAPLFLTACEKEKSPSSYEQGFAKGVQSVKPISIDQQADNVARMVKEDPTLAQPFLQNMVDIACKDNPGLALQVEQYASAEMRRKMEQLLKDANVATFCRQKSEIDSLSARISVLQSQLTDANSKRTVLQGRYDELANQGKTARPVLLVNNWVRTVAVFKMTDKINSKQYVFYVSPQTQATVMMPPGDYLCELFNDNLSKPELVKTVKGDKTYNSSYSTYKPFQSNLLVGSYDSYTPLSGGKYSGFMGTP